MLGVHKDRNAPSLMSFSYYVKGKGGFPGRFRPKNLNDSTARETAHTNSVIDAQRTGWDHSLRINDLL